MRDRDRSNNRQNGARVGPLPGRLAGSDANAPGPPRRHLLARVAGIALLSLALQGETSPADATGTETALGNATTSQGQGDFTINTDVLTEFSQHSTNVILDWQTDLQQPAGHSLEFRQADGFAILNRSPGEHASDFWGRVVCDATCIFTNRAGINFRDGSFVDVGQIIAAAGDLSNSDFLTGEYRFGALDGSVTNSGWMQGSAISLLGRSVANFGHINTPDGSFLMAAGEEILLRDHDSPIIIQSSLSPSEGITPTPAVENTGSIDAGRGHVRMAAGDMLSFAIRSQGSVRAASIELAGGEGGLVEVEGHLDASGLGTEDSGGTIDVLGDYVSIQDGATLDASGSTGGGRIRVGGDRQGASSVRSARGTFVHAGATLKADATELGDGGEVIVWADETAQIYGALSATGGPLGGNGGFAETSGKLWLDLGGSPDLRALSGRPTDQGGSWLIDPNNISIVGAPCDTLSPACLDPGLSQDQLENPLFQFNGGPVVRPTVDDSELQAGLITGALEQGISVTLLTETVDTVQGTQNGNITVLAPINPQAANSAAGTRATLSLLASNDLTLQEEVGVVADPNADPTAASNLVLDIALKAGDLTQKQNPVEAGQISNSYIGTLGINADIRSAGGSILLDGVDINAAAGTRISTNGGAIGSTSFAGNSTFAGEIDTTNPTRDEAGEEVFGGSIGFTSQAAVVPNALGPNESAVVGGDITLAGSIKTDGGSIVLFSAGGNLTLAGDFDTSLVETPSTALPGGNIALRARVTEFGPLSAGDPSTNATGGDITIAQGATLLTQGGSVDIGTDLTSLVASAQKITVNGQIDTRWDNDQTGGDVFFEVSGDAASVTIAHLTPGDATPTRILTQGGRIQSAGSGSFTLEDAVLDARSHASSDPDQRFSDVGIYHVGDIQISETLPGTTLLAADQAIQISPGAAAGTGNMTFSGAPEFIGEEILLAVGDGHGGESTTATIDLGAAVFHAEAGVGAAPQRFSLFQEADLTADGVGSQIAGGDLTLLEQYTLAASDGILSITDPATVSDPDLELRLQAGTGISVGGSFATDPDSLALLDLAVSEEFVVDEALANAISNAGLQLSLSAGAPTTAEDPSLLIEGNLAAEETIVLHAGSGGEGDLAFGVDPVTGTPLSLVLAAEDITLWAGNGDSQGTAQVRSETLTNLSLEDGTGGQVTAFTLRQDAAIGDETIPDAGRFTGGVAGVDYTLRSDGATEGGAGIVLGDNGAEGLVGSQLSLHALGGIDLASITDSLAVETLDIGGLGSFRYTQALNEKIAFTTPSTSQLVLRAGLSTPGVLDFASGMTLAADQIRLVAGDGVGGNGGGSTSSIQLAPQGGVTPIFQPLTPGATLEFVFRQDASIAQSILPSLAANFGAQEPGRLGIRSDDGTLTLNDFSALHALQASEQLVLSAPVVILERADGSDLIVEEALAVNPGALALQIRGDAVVLRASDDGSATTSPVVLPGSEVRLSNFDGEATTGLVPTAFDFNAVPADAPGFIQINQVGDLVADRLLMDSNFIDPTTQLGLAGNAPLNQVLLTSQTGSITVTPETVVGSDLTLALESIGYTESATRTIHFDGGLFQLASLIAVSPFDWVVRRADNDLGETNLELNSEGLLQLRAGLLNQGDLGFAEDVVLDANLLLLSAGDDPLLPLYPNAPPTDYLPVVSLRDATGAATVSLRLRDLENSGAGLQVRQHGSLVDAIPGLAAGESLIPLKSQIEVKDTSGLATTLGQLQLDSVLGDIRINHFSDFSDARNILLGAGQGVDATNLVLLEQSNGSDLDFTQDFESFAIFAPEIQFKTNGLGVIKAENNELLLRGASLFDDQGLFVNTSPNTLLFEQTQSFNESAGDCSTGCLPNPVTQLGPTQAQGIAYTIRTTGGSIRLDDGLYNKLYLSDLTLGAFASGTGPDITVLASSATPDFDIILGSLTFGEDPNTPLNILLSAPESSADNPSLAILTVADQTYNGDLVIDGRVELAGETIHVTSTIEAADDPGNPSQDELVLGLRGQGLLDGDVGVQSQLERFRVNFDPTLLGASDLLPTLGLGGNSADLFTLRAETIEVRVGGDFVGDLEVAHTPRSALASTLFKRIGDLDIVADTFSMGMGEKLSVGGKLSITARTLAGDGLAQIGDLSALEILVDADLIEIQQRAAGRYVDATGVVRPDGGVDYVANEIDFVGTISSNGTGARPVFGIPDPQSTPDWMLAYSTFQSREDGLPLSLDQLAIPPGYDSLADLHPTGGSRDDPSTMFIGSEHVPTPAAWVPAPWLPFNRVSVEELGLDVEPMSQAEYMGQLRRAMVIDDAGHGLTLWDGYRLRISDARVEGTEAAEAVALLDELLGPRFGRATRVREALQDALDQYLRTSGARRVVGFELRRFVKNRPSSLFAAYKALEDLDSLFALHRGLGLTPGEYRPIQSGWLEAIRPQGITTRELAEAIQPSRYVRGSDVLDIFGE
ncbi:MAG: hypothetical protein P8Q97_13740 [Myxococcota bacterium]|nr:hypothetical protein [Myxococcota bacterium]